MRTLDKGQADRQGKRAAYISLHARAASALEQYTSRPIRLCLRRQCTSGERVIYDARFFSRVDSEDTRPAGPHRHIARVDELIYARTAPAERYAICLY